MRWQDFPQRRVPGERLVAAPLILLTYRVRLLVGIKELSSKADPEVGKGLRSENSLVIAAA